jgi:mono/diheme cytochrome c family protein
MSRIHDEEQLPPGVPPVTFAPREPSLRRPPFWFIAAGLILVVGTWVPLVLFARGRVTRSDEPRVQLPQDMGEQPRYREQQTSVLFADGRADRPRVIGTVARGGLAEDDHYYRGYSRPAAPGPDGKAQPAKFFEGFPKQVVLSEALMKRGQERFNIYCSVCHGLDGAGRGAVRVRSEEIGQVLNVKSVHDADVRARPEGHIFNTITNGIRTMGPYSSQIPVEDRWAIVAYVRALQASQLTAPQPPAPNKTADAGGDGSESAESEAAATTAKAN